MLVPEINKKEINSHVTNVWNMHAKKVYTNLILSLNNIAQRFKVFAPKH